MLDSFGVFKRVTYASFSVGPAPGYDLSVGDFSSEQNAFTRDSFRASQGRSFSAKDLDQDDNVTGSCSLEWGPGAAGW